MIEIALLVLAVVFLGAAIGLRDDLLNWAMAIFFLAAVVAFVAVVSL